MNLNKNLRPEKNINDISPTGEKTPFGKLYAVILSALLLVMCIGQFFFPVIKINSSSDEDKLRKAINNAANAVSEHKNCTPEDCDDEKSHYKYEEFLAFNNASGLVMLNEGDYLEPNFFISYNHSKFPISFKDEKRVDSVIKNVNSISNESDYNFSDFINYDIASLISKKDLKYFITGTSESFITVIDNTKGKESYEYEHIIGYDMLKAMKNEAESREFILADPYTSDELEAAAEHYLENENNKAGYDNSFPTPTVPYDVIKYIVENEIADDVIKNGILKSTVENAASATSEADYKYSKFLCYEKAITVFENSEGAYLLPKTHEEMIGDAMTNALRVESDSEYEFSDILDYHVAKSLQKIDNSYQICNIRYSVPLEGKKYALSLATLGFNSDYTIDISCDTNHSNLIISGMVAISFICMIICIFYLIIGIMQLSKNTNKACTTLVVGFIPMIIAKLALIMPVIQIKNFQIIGIESERIAIINDPAHASIILLVSLIISICVPVVSLKTIHRT